MKENDIGFNWRAVNLYELPVEVYARTTNGQDKLSDNIHFSTAMNVVPGSIGGQSHCAAMKIPLY